MTKREKRLVLLRENFVFVEGHDDAVLGTFEGHIVYSANKIIMKFMQRDGMSEETAMEYFDQNISAAFSSEDKNSPIFCEDIA